jgi:hypothetical protein
MSDESATRKISAPRPLKRPSSRNTAKPPRASQACASASSGVIMNTRPIRTPSRITRPPRNGTRISGPVKRRPRRISVIPIAGPPRRQPRAASTPICAGGRSGTERPAAASMAPCDLAADPRRRRWLFGAVSSTSRCAATRLPHRSPSLADGAQQACCPGAAPRPRPSARDRRARKSTAVQHERAAGPRTARLHGARAEEAPVASISATSAALVASLPAAPRPPWLAIGARIDRANAKRRAACPPPPPRSGRPAWRAAARPAAPAPAPASMARGRAPPADVDRSRAAAASRRRTCLAHHGSRQSAALCGSSGGEA